jgi:nucleoid-associated protein EbfC
MGGGFSKLKKQAKIMQEELMKAQNELKDTTIEGIAANGLVKITINGEKELKKIKIDPTCVTDIEGLEDLIIVAFKDAHQKLDKLDTKNLSLNNFLGF